MVDNVSHSDVHPSSLSASSSFGFGSNGIARSGFGLRFPVLSLFRSPLLAVLEYSGIVNPPAPATLGAESLVSAGNSVEFVTRFPDSPMVGSSNNNGEVSITIIGSREDGRDSSFDEDVEAIGCDNEMDIAEDDDEGEDRDLLLMSGNSSSSSNIEDAADGALGNDGGRDSDFQRYDLQLVGRWIEQILPFILILLVVFIRQHLRGFIVSLSLAALMFKSNNILRKQTALKGDRKNWVLVAMSVLFMLYVLAMYWLYRDEGVLYPLLMLPPKVMPPFWHAVFIVMLNDVLVRQAAMSVKCLLLINYKNSRGPNFHKQAQMLTLVEYTSLLYRAVLPAPVWYRFFLNKAYGSLFSSLTTGLYLTFKITSVVEKVRSFRAVIKALSGKDVQYGSHATKDQVCHEELCIKPIECSCNRCQTCSMPMQVNSAGDLCAICQEKMHAPILLRCKHIFCEECATEWLDRERTCPLCRALVRPAEFESFGDGSTSLFFQFF